MQQSRGQLPLETVLLAAILGVLLVYPLLQYPEHDAALAGYRSELPHPEVVSGALRRKHLNLPATQAEASWRLGNGVVATCRLERDPGWPRGDAPSLLARQLGLPPGWTALRLIYADFGVENYRIDTAAIRVRLRLSADQTVVCYPAGGSSAWPGARDATTRPAWEFRDTGGQRSYEIAIQLPPGIAVTEIQGATLQLGPAIEEIELLTRVAGE